MKTEKKFVKWLAILGSLGAPAMALAQQGATLTAQEHSVLEPTAYQATAEEAVPKINSESQLATSFEPIGPVYRYHNCDPCRPRLYLQTETTFLSRQYDPGQSSFNLLNSAEYVPGGNYTNHVVDGDGRLTGLGWTNIPVPALTSQLVSPDETADLLTGAPRLSFGVVSADGWGLQGRYWRMENSIGAFGPLVNLNRADTEAWRIGQLSLTSDFEQFRAQTADLELTRDLEIGRWSGVATIGARYGEIRNSRQSTVDGALRTGTPGLTVSNDALLNSFHTADYDFSSLQGIDFSGAGPTFSLSGIRPLHNNFSLFASTRSSILFGESRNYATVEGQMSSLFDDDFTTATAQAFSTKPFITTELQLGAQWSKKAKFLNGRFFARGAFEYQFWRHSAVQSQATTDPANLGDYGDIHNILRPLNNLGQPRGEIQSGTGTTRGFASASGLQPDFDMLGFAISAGFVW